MYKKLRKSVAEVISSVENPEQFKWNKWLREPQIYLEHFPKPRVEIKQLENFQDFTEPSLYQIKKFSLTKFKVSEEIPNVVVKKSKSFKIFFNFPKPYPKKLTIFESDVSKQVFQLKVFEKGNEIFFKTQNESKQSTLSLTPKSIAKRVEPLKSSVSVHKTVLKKARQSKHSFHLIHPECLDLALNPLPSLTPDKIYNIAVLRPVLNKKYLALAFKKLDKKPSVKNVTVSTIDEIKAQLQKTSEGKIRAIPIDIIDKVPKQIKVKFVQLINVKTPLYYLKHVRLKETKLKSAKLDLLEREKITTKNPDVDIDIKLRIINPGILKQLNAAEIKESKEPKGRKPKVKFKKDAPASKTTKAEKIKEINWQEVESEFKHLASYRRDGIQLLLTKKTSLLCDELGIDKKDQVISALNSALKNGVIKNAMVICPDSHIGNWKISEQIKNACGWENQIFYTNPELEFTTLRTVSEFENIQLSEVSGIIITNYPTLIELSKHNTIDHTNYSVDCLILDEAQHLLNNEIELEQLFNLPDAKYRWVLTSLPSQIIEERLVPKLTNHLIGFNKLDGVLNRTKHSLGGELPPIIRTDYWHELDVDQKQEFENTLVQGRKRIVDLVKGGNPFIIQSNIFTFIHQIKQIGNFSTHKETSPKAEMLLDQTEAIIASGQKCIIFSQYDKQGIQKIEQLLKNNRIRYVRYQSGMPLNELEKSVESFSKESKVGVMLAGLTTGNVKAKIPEASYLIHFDQWWNPINQWQHEEKSFGPEELSHHIESMNVINYFSNNSVELNIRSVLEKKGFLIKNMIEFLSSETIYSLISNDEWLEILGVENSKPRKILKPFSEEILAKLYEMPSDELAQRSKLLFSKLGYKNLMVNPNPQNEILIIYGVAQKGLHEIKSAFILAPFESADAEQINSSIKEVSKHNNRITIVCSRKISDQIDFGLHDRAAFVTPEILAGYFSMFNVS